MQQFYQFVFQNDFTWGGGDVFTHDELAFVRHGDAAFFQIRQVVLHAFNQALALGLKRFLQGFWIGHQVVIGIHGRQVLAGHESHIVLLFCA